MFFLAYNYGYGYGYYLDPTYILVIIGMLFTMAASAGVNSTFNKYSKMYSRTGMTGAQAARRILDAQGLYDVGVEHISGNLSDHYDPTKRVVRLSDSTYGSTSVAAVGVAAHECGHAKQHATGYAPMSIRHSLVPIANLGSRLGMPILILGIILSMNQTLINIGIWAYALGTLFHIVTLPVEFDASNRAVRLLQDTGILFLDEAKYTRKVLNAAAMTYVASTAASLLSLLRLILLYGGGRRRK